MAKRITGRSKLADSAVRGGETDKALNLTKVSQKTTLKTYRLYDSDIVRLKEITLKMNQSSHRHISETAAIRALLVLGSGINGEKLLAALREAL